MGFKEVQDLDAEITTALGGVNKKTGKPNPKQVEGYFIGSRTVDSPKAKNGVAKLHIFQTAKGNIGVWGKTDLDRKLANVTPGVMVRATCTGMQAIPGKNDMYKYKVEIDSENAIEVTGAPAGEDLGGGGEEPAAFGNDDAEEELGLEDDEPALDEVPPARPRPAARPAQTGASTTKRVQDLLAGRKNAS